jgi:DinB superfamily
MQFVRMTSVDLEPLFAQLAAMPTFLQKTFGALAAQDATWRASSDTFAPVEQCWHLADLERDGFAVRVRRLLSETAPILPDFDGARAAEEGRYITRSLAEGLKAFQEARLVTLEQLRAIAPLDWSRTGTQQGVGVVALCDMPRMMAAHDAEHRQEIEEWVHRRGARNAAG